MLSRQKGRQRRSISSELRLRKRQRREVEGEFGFRRQLSRGYKEDVYILERRKEETGRDMNFGRFHTLGISL